MRPYQIAATERILWKIKSSYNAKKWGTTESGGYIWHTTGSGKTLTSFKAARLATELDYIDKVFFVVDRKDLDYQTMKEYQRFSPDSVNGSENTIKVDYNDVRPKFKDIEMEQDEKKLTAAETKEALLHPERIREISQYILDNFRVKTHRAHIGAKGFNAMFAVSSVEAAKLYYETLNNLQKGCEKPLTIVCNSFSASTQDKKSRVLSAKAISMPFLNWL